MREAKFYSILNNGNIRCELCPHYCILKEGIESRCHSRKVINGKLIATNYGQTISLSIDPIEKKPLYHFYPGSEIFSIGANSCNFSCSFCQNYSISQNKVQTQEISKESILAICEKHNINMVAFTYTEPFTWYEFIFDSAKYLQKNNIKIVLVTNGFINQKPLKKLLPFIDAMNIDLKSFEDKFYKDLCGGKLQPVLDTIKTVFEFQVKKSVILSHSTPLLINFDEEYKSIHCHLEITNLLITNENDDLENIKNLVDFVASISPEIPLHFSRYYPQYKLSNPPTEIKILQEAQAIGKKKLNYVYQGNVINSQAKSTYCPNCGELLIKRDYYLENYLDDDKCPNCQKKIYGKW